MVVHLVPCSLMLLVLESELSFTFDLIFPRTFSSNFRLRSNMESEKEYENLVNIICRKMAHIIVESRLGRRIQTPCKVHADGADWVSNAGV